MKTRTRYLNKLVLCLAIVSPAIVNAAPPTTSPYYTDTTNSYVQDETTQAMSSLNGLLCDISAMAPAQMVNLGDYIALVDVNACNPNSSGGSSASNNSGASYYSFVVNSSRVDNNSPMIAKIWLDEPANGYLSMIHLSATQAPNATDPHGRFRMDYCSVTSTDTNCPNIGYINSTANGLDYYLYSIGAWGTAEMKLKLNASGNSTGSGALTQTYTGAGMPTDSTFTFAYNADYFRRSDGVSDLCFDRSAANASESVWSYGLYDVASGARIERNSGFPIEYTDLATQTTMNGYIGYWGLSARTEVDTSKPVNQVTYGSGGATKTPYTLMQTGGKLIKYSLITKTLAQLDKIKFIFWASRDVGGVTVPATPSTLTSGTSYEVYWDNSYGTSGTFWITGQRDPSTYNVVPYAAEVALSIADMQLAAPYGIYGYSNMLGGSFNIPGSDMPALGGSTNVKMQTQDVVYPSEFASLGGMMCINNCPTAADIALSNAALVGSPVSPFQSATVGWAVSPGKALYNYTLDAATGNLMDATTAAAISTATTGNNTYGITSGRLVATADLALLDAAVAARSGTAGNYTQADIDALPTYYEWRTGPNNWNQLSILTDAANAPVRFDPPLNVNFTVPNVAKYGTTAGATINLQYGGFGNLWGIPSTCVDSATNLACTFGAGGTAPGNQRWTPEFSIPTSLSSVVTVPYDQGSAVAGTTYLVKALYKEVRLANVPLLTCDGAGLTVPDIATVTLPTADPSAATTAKSIGAMPTFNPQPAPRVIQGVKMY